MSATHDPSVLFIELGLAIVGLAILARVANRWGFSAIPLYLLAGLAFGNGGLVPLRLSEPASLLDERRDFVGAEVDVCRGSLVCGRSKAGRIRRPGNAATEKLQIAENDGRVSSERTRPR